MMRARRSLVLVLPLAVLALIALPALAQDDAAALRRAAAAAEGRARAIEADVRAQDRRADAALGDAARAAARMAAAEARAARARAELARIDRLRRAQATRLAAAREPLARLAAALQLMARRPPALAIVAPGSTGDLVHVRLALDAAAPVIAERTAALRREIAAADALRLAGQAAARARDAATLALRRERAELLRLAEARRAEAASLSGEALAASDRALALAADAAEAEAERQNGAPRRDSALAAALAALPAPAATPPTASPPPPLFWQLPVDGRVVTGFGERTADGVRSRGVTLAPPPGRPVVAPAAGRVAWAGPFPGYGQVVILAHSGSRTTMIAGLADRAVETGDSVLTGARLGRAGRRVTVELRKGETPVDLAAIARGG